MNNKTPLFWLLAVVVCFGLYVAGWVHGTYFEVVWPFGGRPEAHSELAADQHADHNHAHMITMHMPMTNMPMTNMPMHPPAIFWTSPTWPRKTSA